MCKRPSVICFFLSGIALNNLLSMIPEFTIWMCVHKVGQLELMTQSQFCVFKISTALRFLSTLL